VQHPPRPVLRLHIGLDIQPRVDLVDQEQPQPLHQLLTPESSWA
jgi:hypothetical protein